MQSVSYLCVIVYLHPLMAKGIVRVVESFGHLKERLLHVHEGILRGDLHCDLGSRQCFNLNIDENLWRFSDRGSFCVCNAPILLRGWMQVILLRWPSSFLFRGFTSLSLYGVQSVIWGLVGPQTWQAVSASVLSTSLVHTLLIQTSAPLQAFTVSERSVITDVDNVFYETQECKKFADPHHTSIWDKNWTMNKKKHVRKENLL